MQTTRRTRFRDRYGLPLTASSATAVDHYVEGVDRILAFEVGAEDCFRHGLAEDEAFALAYTGLALALRPQGRLDEARTHLQRAGELANRLTPREQQHVRVAEQLINGNPATALEQVTAYLREYPRDALLLHASSIPQSNSGRLHRQEERVALLEELAPHYGDDWYFLSARAFLLEEVGQFETARRLAEQGLSRYPRSGAAVHALAHVFYETSDHASGVDFLTRWMEPYDSRAPMYGHFAWHRALSALALGHHEEVQHLYAEQIFPTLGHSRTSLPDAASLLWRLRLYGGAEEPLPWAAVCKAASRLTAQVGLSFNDVHAGLAFAAQGDQASLGRLVDQLQTLAGQGHPVAGSVVLPLVEALVAFTRGDYAGAIRGMEPIWDQVVRVGGSNAQREVFEDTLLQAYLRTERYERAVAVLRERLARRPSARDLLWLAQAEAATGQPAQAQVHLDQARALWSEADPDSPEFRILAELAQRTHATHPDGPTG